MFEGRCVKCGKCKGVCPTYRSTLREDMSPRGRVHLAELVERGELEPEDVSQAFTSCLLCMACEEVCPQFVDVTSRVERVRRSLHSFSSKAMEGALGVAENFVNRRSMRVGSSEKGCAVFVGCVVGSAMPQLLDRLVEVLVRLGYSVDVPEGQVCCGHPFEALGVDGAHQRIEHNKKLFSKYPEVITLCSTCASYLKRRYGLRVRDFAEVFASFSFALDVRNADRVAFHVPCHLKRGQGVDIGRVLEEAGISVLSEECCGFGGVTSILHPELSVEVGRRRLEEAVALGKDTVVTVCPACMMQLRRVAVSQGFPVKVRHLVEVVE